MSSAQITSEVNDEMTYLAERNGFVRNRSVFKSEKKDGVSLKIELSVSKTSSGYYVDPILLVFWEKFSLEYHKYEIYNNANKYYKPEKNHPILILYFRAISSIFTAVDYDVIEISDVSEARIAAMHIESRHEKPLSEVIERLSTPDGILRWFQSHKESTGSWSSFAEFLLLEEVNGNGNGCIWANEKLKQYITQVQADGLNYLTNKYCTSSGR